MSDYQDPWDEAVKGWQKGWSTGSALGKPLGYLFAAPFLLIIGVPFLFILGCLLYMPRALLILIRTGFGIQFISAMHAVLAGSCAFIYFLMVESPLAVPFLGLFLPVWVIQMIAARRAFKRNEQHVDSVGGSLLLFIPTVANLNNWLKGLSEWDLFHTLVEPVLVVLIGGLFWLLPYPWAAPTGYFFIYCGLWIAVVGISLELKDHQLRVQMNKQHFAQQGMPQVNGQGASQPPPTMTAQAAHQSTSRGSNSSASKILRRLRRPRKTTQKYKRDER